MVEPRASPHQRNCRLFQATARVAELALGPTIPSPDTPPSRQPSSASRAPPRAQPRRGAWPPQRP
eukprot:3915621-Alexandrium_andersonii.AAC.1